MKKQERKKNASLHIGLLLLFCVVFIAGTINCSLEYGREERNTGETSSPVNKDSSNGGNTLESFKTSGDFNGDGFVDQAVGDKWASSDVISNYGNVTVTYGNNARSPQVWTQDSPGVPGSCEDEDKFGQTLAAGDFNGDGYDDLAVGTPHEGIGDYAGAGCVIIIYGASSGLRGIGSKMFHQDVPFIQGSCEVADYFGLSLATGDIDNNGYTDLVIGVQAESIGDIANAGAVQVIYGTKNGLKAIGNQFFCLNTPGVPGISEEYTYFGEYITVGDYNGDNYTDLAAAAHMATINSVEEAGAVIMLFGTSGGLSTTGSLEIHAETPGIDRECRIFGHFGLHIITGKLKNPKGSGPDDLVIGDSGATVIDDYMNIGTGEIYVCYGTPCVGYSADNVDIFNRASDGIPGDPTHLDTFGAILETGYVNGDSYQDLTLYDSYGLDYPDYEVICTLYGSSSGLHP